jgi:hypothetical protein
MTDSHKAPDKWDCLKLLPALTAFAGKLFLQESISARDDIMPATGKSPRGLAFDAITEFIEDEGTKFRPRSPQTYEKDLFNYLRVAVFHDFLDLIKGHEYQKTEVIDSTRSVKDKETKLALEEMGSTGSEDGFYSLECAMLARKLLPLVEDEPELKEYLEAVLSFGVTKREDIASMIDKSPQEVTYRRNRLRDRLASWHRAVHASRKVVSTHGKER